MFQLSDIDGSSSAVTEVVPPDQEAAVRRGRPVVPGAGDPHRRGLKSPIPQQPEDSALTSDDATTDEQRRQPRYHFDRHTPDYRVVREDHRGDARQVPDRLVGHLRRALGGRRQQAVFELARCPHISNDHDINGERKGYKGISIPTSRASWCAAASWRWTNRSTAPTAAR
jgi:hypothetical protein